MPTDVAKTDVRFTDAQLAIVRFCAIECHLQQSGECSVEWMIRAWMYALGRVRGDAAGFLPTEADVWTLGEIVEPDVNARGYRQVGVRVGHNVKMDWSLVPGAMEHLLSDGPINLTPAEWFREYEEIHPFRDGNGRTGQILFNWLSGTLHAPVWAPNFWDDYRRQPGAGAPSETSVWAALTDD